MIRSNPFLQFSFNRAAKRRRAGIGHDENGGKSPFCAGIRGRREPCRLLAIIWLTVPLHHESYRDRRSSIGSADCRSTFRQASERRCVAYGRIGARLVAQRHARATSIANRDEPATKDEMERMMVGETGFEPATSCSQSRRATGLRHSPTVSSLRRAGS